MSDLFEQAVELENEFKQLAQAEELDDGRITTVLKRRDALHRQLGAQVDSDESLINAYRPFFQSAYDNTQALQQRCETERNEIKEKLITLNTSKKARKAY